MKPEVELFFTDTLDLAKKYQNQTIQNSKNLVKVCQQ